MGGIRGGDGSFLLSFPVPEYYRAIGYFSGTGKLEGLNPIANLEWVSVYHLVLIRAVDKVFMARKLCF